MTSKITDILSIESKEIIIDNDVYPLKSIYDLSGHNIAPYIIHVDKAVPNIKLPYYERMLEDEVFAIETFPTTGNGEIYECKECNHFMIESKNKLSKNVSDQIQTIINTRDTLGDILHRWFQSLHQKCLVCEGMGRTNQCRAEHVYK